MVYGLEKVTVTADYASYPLPRYTHLCALSMMPIGLTCSFFS